MIVRAARQNGAAIQPACSNEDNASYTPQLESNRPLDCLTSEHIRKVKIHTSCSERLPVGTVEIPLRCIR